MCGTLVKGVVIVAKPIRKCFLTDTIIVTTYKQDGSNTIDKTFTVTNVRVRKNKSFQNVGYGLEEYGRFELWADAKNTPDFSTLVTALQINSTIEHTDEYGVKQVTRVSLLDTPITDKGIHHLKATLV